MFYLDFLTDLHRRLSPQTYLEIGVRNGYSLALAQCRAVGIDPNFSIHAELDGDLALFRTTSDEYFSRSDPLAATSGIPFDLAFIDGLHLFEYALRDFISAERHASDRGLIIFDDVMPRNVEETARERSTVGWTGDVFRVVSVLEKYRPDLVVIPIDTRPTGLLIIAGVNPENSALSDNYDAIMAEFRQPDPQEVPAELLDRLSVVAPQRFLDSGVLELLAGAGERGAGADEVRRELQDVVVARLGHGFVPAVA